MSQLFLRNNECIDEKFDGAASIAEVPRIVTEKCRFEEVKSDVLPSANVEICLAEKAQLEADLKATTEELLSLKLKYAKLEREKAQIDSRHIETYL